MKYIKYPHSKLATFLGALTGGLLCFGFYKVTGLQVTFLSAAPLLRQIADVLCFAAFATFATVWASWVFSAFASSAAQADSKLQSPA